MSQRFVAALLLVAAGCGPARTGFDGFWYAEPKDNGDRVLGVAIGWEGNARVWTADGFPLQAAEARTRAHCQNFWTDGGGAVAYIGPPGSLEANDYVAGSDVSVSAEGVGTLTWQMSRTFDDDATRRWLAAHPDADPALRLGTRVTVTAILFDPDTLDLHGTVVTFDAGSGAVLSREHPDWRLRRQAECMLSPEF